MTAKHSLQYIQDYFIQHNCILLTKKYINNRQKLNYICDCLNEVKITFGHFQEGQRCGLCGVNNKKLSYEYVKDYFKKHGCKLLSKQYINSYSKLDYECVCKNNATISFDNFKQGYRCQKCGIQKSLNTKIIRGYCTNRIYKNKFELYSARIRNASNRTYKKYKDIINPLNLKRAPGHYHLDHKFSTFEGFKNNIPVFIMASIHNLEMLTENENLSKSRKSSITKENLLESFYLPNNSQ